jgi:hypothetical protein
MAGPGDGRLPGRRPSPRLRRGKHGGHGARGNHHTGRPGAGAGGRKARDRAAAGRRRVLATCRGDDPAAHSAALGADGHQVIEGYRRLREELRALRLPAQVADELDAILGHHLELVGLALNLTYRPQSPRIREQRHRLRGLGRYAGDLRALRDRLAAELEADGP